ncbi:MAG: 3-phosphoshikimate 1-carboxyvinyltransferase [Chloroflexota bacterium]
MKWRIRGLTAVADPIRLPGDKSITHRALLIGALAAGDTRIRGASWSDDCRSSLTCLAALGVRHEFSRSGSLIVHGSGGTLRPAFLLDCGNSGTTMRLLAGILAGQPFRSRLDGDQSLRARPMERIAVPLRAMGARVATADGRPPLVVDGGGLHGIDWHTEVASAQVKSAILLAALSADGPTTVHEPAQSRDHTERLLAAAGARIRTGLCVATLVPAGPLSALDVAIPFDFSAAAYWLAAAIAVDGSSVTLAGVGLNPTRIGLLDALQRMGGACALSDVRSAGGEPVGVVSARSSDLVGITVGGAEIPRLIDELPVLAVLATAARGQTIIRDAAELRVKESDRIEAMTTGLRRFGADIQALPDGWLINGPTRLTAAQVDCKGDHRVAMALAVAALMAEGISEIVGVETVSVSDPLFAANLAACGALADS